MKQQNSILIESENKKIKIYADTDTALGAFHDFLLLVKGNIVERMVKVQKEEEEASKKQEAMEQKPKEEVNASEEEKK